MLVIQGLQKPLHKLGGGAVIAGQKSGAWACENRVEVIEGHVSQIGIGIVELG